MTYSKNILFTLENIIQSQKERFYLVVVIFLVPLATGISLWKEISGDPNYGVIFSSSVLLWFGVLVLLNEHSKSLRFKHSLFIFPSLVLISTSLIMSVGMIPASVMILIAGMIIRFIPVDIIV